MTPKSKYLDRFQRLAAEAKEAYQLIGDCLLVEEVSTGETRTAGGIIIAESAKNVDGFGQNKPTLVHILAVGEGYYSTETKDDGTESEIAVPLNVKVGDMALTGQMSVRWLSVFGPIVSEKEARIGLAREQDLQIIFKDYAAVYAALANQANTF